jgi:hypothetical protein
LYHNNVSIPHANAYRHDGTIPRTVVYCSFLPDVPINRQYVQQQLQYWKEGRFPSGNQWINHSGNNNSNQKNSTVSAIADATAGDDAAAVMLVNDAQCKKRSQDIRQILSTPLARRLAGVDDWELPFDL